MPIKQCRMCKSDFYAKPNWLKRGWGKYCSLACMHEGAKSGKMVSCFICGKEVYKTLKALSHSKSKKYFCGKSCQTKWRNSEFIGLKHANWKHGGFVYKSILTRAKVPPICRICQTTDKRILAVHHIDKNKKNNTLKNLAWLCHNCHFLVHHYTEGQEKLMATLV